MRVLCAQVLQANGAPTSATAGQDKEMSSSHESVEHRTTGGLRDAAERGRSLSARSFDPLPEVPKLEVAGAEGSKEDGDDDDDDDDPYAVVPADDIDRMPDSDSDEGNRDEADAEPPKPPQSSSPFPPYGKVSRHGKPQSEPKEVEDDSYAEVRDVIRRGPLPLALRERSQTQPADPANLLLSPRDKRSLTDSASATHMPLPDIPAMGPLPVVIPEEESIMYDSIPEQDRKAAPTAARPTSIKKKERLYESVGEMEDKDLYESVPDSLSKVDQPTNPGTASTPSTPGPSFPPKLFLADPPMAPRTSRPREHEKQAKKKALEKMLSASTTEEGKRRFSFFGRKKTASVSTNKPKKAINQQPELPTAAALTLSGSPQHKSPPLPNIPVPPRPDEEEEDTYDKVTPSLSSAGMVHTDIFQHDDARSKSASLPMSYRTGGGTGGGGGGGGRPNLPLPRLPEDSGSATVQHVQGTGGPDDYDMVHITERIPDEPNYDTVEFQHHVHVPPAEDPDPPYDRIDKQELQEIRDREMQREKLNPPSPEQSTTTSSSDKLEDPGLPPDHDEEGYAVVPEEIRMRKRALQGVRQLSPNSTGKGYDVIRHRDDEQPYNAIPETRSHTVSSALRSTSGKSLRGSEEDQYASVDMVAKQGRKKKELEEALRMQGELRGGDHIGTSPVPPPLPPALNPDDLDEFKEPPVPRHLEGMCEMMNGELEVPNATADPPYAKVRSNPYSEVVSRPYAEVDVDYFQNQAGVRAASDSQASGARPLSSEEILEDEAGYDVIGAVSKQPAQQEKKRGDKPYDTIQDVRVYMEGGPSHTEQEMPMLETAESANIYDSLLPSPPTHAQEEEEVRYEVIDTKRDTPRSMV